MNPDVPVAEYLFVRGALRGSQLTLYPNRIVHEGAGSTETVALAQLAAVRVAYQRDAAKLGWALALLAVALACAAAAGPLQGWTLAAAAELAEQARRESQAGGVPGVLHGTVRALGVLASLLPMLAAALGALGALLVALYWIGHTTFTLCFAAAERNYPVRGRNARMLEFAETVSASIAALHR